MRETRHTDLARAADHPEAQALLHVVVVTVLRIDDAYVNVVRAGQQLERVHAEARNALSTLRHLDAVHERVRSVDADAIVAVDIEAEDRVAHARGVAVVDLEGRGLTRFQDATLVAVARHDARTHDLDLLAAVA